MENNSIPAAEVRKLVEDIFKNKKIFFNKDFDFNLGELKLNMQHDFIQWCKEVFAGKIPHTPITHKKYREWALFINKIADKRALVVKIKNQAFIEVHLSGHKYYDKQRERFGIKKGSKYY